MGDQRIERRPALGEVEPRDRLSVGGVAAVPARPGRVAVQRAVGPDVAANLHLLEPRRCRQEGEERVVQEVARGLGRGLAVVRVPAAEAVGVVRTRVARRRHPHRVRAREDVAEHVLAETLDEAPAAGDGRHHPAVPGPELRHGQVVGAPRSRERT